MKTSGRKLLAALAACIAVVCIVLLLSGLRRHSLLNARRSDVEALVKVCFTTDRLATTDDLLATARRQGVRLRSPIAVNPGEPCYRLVNPWLNTENNHVFEVGKLLIAETNIKDTNGMFVAQMDGSVLFVSPRRLQTSSTNSNQRPASSETGVKPSEVGVKP